MARYLLIFVLLSLGCTALAARAQIYGNCGFVDGRINAGCAMPEYALPLREGENLAPYREAIDRVLPNWLKMNHPGWVYKKGSIKNVYINRRSSDGVIEVVRFDVVLHQIVRNIDETLEVNDLMVRGGRAVCIKIFASSCEDIPTTEVMQKAAQDAVTYADTNCLDVSSTQNYHGGESFTDCVIEAPNGVCAGYKTFYSRKQYETRITNTCSRPVKFHAYKCYMMSYGPGKILRPGEYMDFYDNLNYLGIDTVTDIIKKYDCHPG